MALISTTAANGYAERVIDVAESWTGTSQFTLYLEFNIPADATSGSLFEIGGMSGSFPRYARLEYDAATGNILSNFYAGSDDTAILGAAVPGTWQRAFFTREGVNTWGALDGGVDVTNAVNTDLQADSITYLRATTRLGMVAHAYLWRRVLTQAERDSLRAGAHPNTIDPTLLNSAYSFVDSLASTGTYTTPMTLYNDAAVNTTDPYGITPPTITETLVADAQETAFTGSIEFNCSVHNAATHALIGTKETKAVTNGAVSLTVGSGAYSTEYLVEMIATDRSISKTFYSTTQVDPSL